MNPIRSIIAVLAGLGLTSIVVEVLEFTLVSAVGGGAIPDMAGYFAVRNRPAMLGAALAYTALGGVLGGYLTAKVAADRAMLHTAAAAGAKTLALIWGFTAGEHAGFTPAWMRVALVLLTGLAMMAGGAVRARAAGSM